MRFECKNCKEGVFLIELISRYILECQTYTILNAADRRDTYSTVQANLRCDDSVTSGWYRFDGAAGTKF